VIGRDANGERLSAELAKYAIDTGGLVEVAARPTTEKQRVIAGSQQLMRVDYEELAEVDGSSREQIVADVTRRLAAGDFEAVILEDYAKGLLAEDMAQAIVDAARRYGVIVALDPKPRHPMKLKGLTMMKPNRGEAFDLAGAAPVRDERVPEAVLREVARKIRGEWAVENLLISLAAQGMALYSGDDELKLIPTRAREVYDVSGAGDTVIAAATLALAAGCAAEIAAEIANHAAGVVVGKLGTVTVSLEELSDSIRDV